DRKNASSSITGVSHWLAETLPRAALTILVVGVFVRQSTCINECSTQKRAEPPEVPHSVALSSASLPGCSLLVLMGLTIPRLPCPNPRSSSTSGKSIEYDYPRGFRALVVV